MLFGRPWNYEQSWSCGFAMWTFSTQSMHNSIRAGEIWGANYCKQCLPNVPQLVRRHNSPHSVREPQSVCGLSTQFAAFQDARKKLSQICCAISEALCLEPSDSTAENLLFHCPCKIITAEGIILQNCLKVACSRQPEIESKIPCSGWVILCMDSVSDFKKITFLNLLRQNTIRHNTNWVTLSWKKT